MSPSNRKGLNNKPKSQKDPFEGYVLREPLTLKNFRARQESILVENKGEKNKNIDNYFLRVPVEMFSIDGLTLTDILIYSRISDLAFSGKKDYDMKACSLSDEEIGAPLLLSRSTVYKSIIKLSDVFEGYNLLSVEIDNRPNVGIHRRVIPRKNFFNKGGFFVKLYYGIFSYQHLVRKNGQNSYESCSREFAFYYSYIFSIYSFQHKSGQLVNGYMEFSVNAMANKLQISRNTLKSYIEEMNEFGFLQIYDRKGSPSYLKPLVNLDRAFKKKDEKQ